MVLVAELVLPYFPPHLGTMRRIVYHPPGSGNYALTPQTSISFGGMFERISPAVTWQVNGEGIRSDRPTPPLSDSYRIATYGDSETFGWSVDLNDTYQRRMEALDPRVEVLNFGVPGYNAQQIADRIEDTVPRYRPDLVLYLVNKNDVDAAIDVSEPVAASELLLRLRFLHQVLLTKPWRHQQRNSVERYQFLAAQLDRIAAYTARNDVPLFLAFMRTRTVDGASPYSTTAVRRGAPDDEHSSVHWSVVEDPLGVFPSSDDHLPREAYSALAQVLCVEISQGAPGRCIPPSWQPSAARLPHSLNVGG
jgi:hypothetical protein